MEITAKFDLSTEEENLLDMHSVLNVLNVITYELVELSESLGSSIPIENSINTVGELAEQLTDRNQALRQIDNVEHFISTVTAAIGKAEQNRSAEEQELINRTKENLRSIFNVLTVRAREIVARAEDPYGWVHHDIGELKENFFQVFKAIELNSNGSYHIVGNIARYEEGDYFLTLEIDSEGGNTIYMPAVFQDVMRDLIANARKYTPPGGEIIAGLYQNKDVLRFVVTDTGRGIPEAEIDGIIHFGSRGSNVHDRPTRGGGFGLTKAYYITKLQKGRMWIENREPSGTRIEILIPLPS